MTEARGSVLPIYLVVDESGSMAPHLDELTDGIRRLAEILLSEPMAAAKVRFSLLGFSDDVIERSHLRDLRTSDLSVRLEARGSTNFATLFDDLAERIPRDVRELKADGYSVHRPAVFMLTDGLPNGGDDWVSSHGCLVDRTITPAAPNIIACGIGDADPHVLGEVATAPHFAFIVDRGVDVGEAVARFSAALTRSVIASGLSLSSDAPQLVVERPEGFTVAIDVI
ncbi:VWA domain-containing protein [Streptomyces sp. NPDC051445]|uniref:vWA domain-containing protein n=1 Tax=Streptomyces sp. NPDC051445 TaxID=3365653 RepID=UPI00378EA7C2